MFELKMHQRIRLILMMNFHLLPPGTYCSDCRRRDEWARTLEVTWCCHWWGCGGFLSGVERALHPSPYSSSYPQDMQVSRSQPPYLVLCPIGMLVSHHSTNNSHIWPSGKLPFRASMCKNDRKLLFFKIKNCPKIAIKKKSCQKFIFFSKIAK